MMWTDNIYCRPVLMFGFKCHTVAQFPLGKGLHVFFHLHAVFRCEYLGVSVNGRVCEWLTNWLDYWLGGLYKNHNII